MKYYTYVIRYVFQIILHYLIDVSCSVVVDSEHWHQSIGHPIGAGNVSALCPDAVDVESNAAGRFRNERSLLEGVVDALDGVIAHRE